MNDFEQDEVKPRTWYEKYEEGRTELIEDLKKDGKTDEEIEEILLAFGL